jgi:regulator of replication initiation timing
LAKAQSNQTNTESENDRLTAEVQEAKAEIVTLTADLGELKKENTTLRIEVNAYKEVEAKKDEEIKTLQNHVSTLEIQVNGLKKDLSDNQQSYRELLLKFDPESNAGELTTSKLELKLNAKPPQTTTTQVAITRTTAQTTSSSSYDVTSPRSPRISSQLMIDRKLGSKSTSTSPSSPRMMSPRSPRSPMAGTAGQSSPTFGVQSKFG